MHMSDALLSPGVGAAFWAFSAAAIGYSARKIRSETDESLIPLMGVLSAFVFAAQMINFSIPGTGSSGHLVGALLLSICLGPYRGFLAVTSVLIIQCLFFADGGLMALGANIFNMGFWAPFVVYRWVWKPWMAGPFSAGRLAWATFASAILATVLGAGGVILETVVSRISDLPFRTFAVFMLPIHLAIGIVEGGVTSGILLFVLKARPELLRFLPGERKLNRSAFAKAAAMVMGLALVTGGCVSWFASTHPDGLEWSVGKTAGVIELPEKSRSVQAWMKKFQRKLAPLNDYGFPRAGSRSSAFAVRTGNSVSGTAGVSLALLLAAGLGLLVRRRQGNAPQDPGGSI